MRPAVFARSLTLPLFETMQKRQQEEVVQQVLSVIGVGSY